MDWDAIVVGSGFGGTLAAYELVRAGWRVLMLERGDWVKRGPENWAPRAVGPLTPYFSTETPYRARAGGERKIVGSFQCVGGPSVFYGGVSLRFRVEDFEPRPEIVGGTGARWPITYADLEPYYARADHRCRRPARLRLHRALPQHPLPPAPGGALAHRATLMGSRP